MYYFYSKKCIKLPRKIERKKEKKNKSKQSNWYRSWAGESQLLYVIEKFIRNQGCKWKPKS